LAARLALGEGSRRGEGGDAEQQQGSTGGKPQGQGGHAEFLIGIGMPDIGAHIAERAAAAQGLVRRRGAGQEEGRSEGSWSGLPQWRCSSPYRSRPIDIPC